CVQLKTNGLEQFVFERTGLRIDPYFSATKIRWILDHVPQAQQRAERGELAFGTIDSWLLWQLSDGAHHYTDVTNAARTMLFNIKENCWDADLIQLFNIPEAILPEVKASSGYYFHSTNLLGAPIPVHGVAGDQQAALFGQA